MTSHGQRDPRPARKARDLRHEIDRLGFTAEEFQAFCQTAPGVSPAAFLEQVRAKRYRQGAAARAEAGRKTARGDIRDFDINDPDPEDFTGRRAAGVPMTDAERALR